MNTISIRLTDVKIKKNHPYTLYFKFIKAIDYTGNEYELEYYGSDVSANNLALDEEAKEKILCQLRRVYGYGPFDRKKIKTLFKENEHLISW